MQILKNKDLNSELEINGFVKLDFLTQNEVLEILSFYKTEIEDRQRKLNGSIFHTTSNSSDFEMIRKVNNFLNPIFESKLKEVLVNHRITIANFLVKEPSNVESVGAHMDWSFVDEKEFKSIGIWVCLTEANYKTGNMQFVPGSHKFFPSLRASPSCPIYYENFKDEVKKYLLDIKTKSGECIIFFHNTIHSSRKNKSSKPRISCVTAGVPENAQLKHFYIDPKDENKNIECYDMEIEDFLQLEHTKRPKKAKFSSYVFFNYVEMNKDNFVKLCKSNISKVELFKTKLINYIYK